MSELKYYKLFHRTSALTSPEFISVVEFGTGDEVCLKSEADKVIADLEADYKEACDRLQTANLIKDEQLAATRHQKYKRCLAMAKDCKDNADWWDYEQINRLNEQRGNAESLRFKAAHSKFCFYVKWEDRWLELAEKFKEAK